MLSSKWRQMRFSHVRRRDFITLLGGAVVTWPLTARAQQPKVWRIGMLETISAELNAANLGAFRQGLHALGYVEGQNLVLDYRSADGDAKRFPRLVAELIHLHVDLIVTRGTPAVLAAKNATSTIPVVMAASGEPLLVVASLARPGGNVTGLSAVTPDLTAKRIELLTELAPAVAGIAAFFNMSNPVTSSELKEIESAARSKGLRNRLFDVQQGDDIRRAFDAVNREHVVALDAVTQAHREMIVELAARYRLPAIYSAREFVDAGGLMSYGTNYPDNYGRAATYADKILKGAKPADLPVEQPTKFELAINLKTAKALGLTVPLIMQMTADEMIE
jgi:putative tryptophan/tyrosine transport system substrate-binding protein